ncbi:MAG: (E)-4-hydroxy-3-methylbut-2-enyl-diphosphate synthase [Rhabdochlamydiaceae bacterium]|nr:(E)-4-hydroxy-3-methylbut-2-enyl-diphosphate synthase [Candidatus Amphrikana amoebophyrae]
MMYKSREVKVGKVGVGGNNPLRIQSMTTSPTDDIESTVAQIIQLADYGSEIARITVQGKKEAFACEHIKNRLLQLGYDIPLVADIHFYPPAALIVADFVDKVRINPGNFADRRATFKTIEYTDALYAQEIEKIEEKFAPLILKLKSQKKVMRIGCNHGSLSDRILNRFGDTPHGMVESALEYARVARKYDFHDLIFSMKASNTHVMIQAYRLLVEKMTQLGFDYPLHLGVTEAGEGEDGRVRSSIGIGSLLLDGIGDTIRVSLTEDPWLEIDPCKRIRQVAGHNAINSVVKGDEKLRRKVDNNPILHRDSTVALMGELGKADLHLTSQPISLKEFQMQKLFGKQRSSFVALEDDQFDQFDADLLFVSPKQNFVQTSRKIFARLDELKIKTPAILNYNNSNLDWDDFVIESSMLCGSLLCDGLGDGLLLQGPFSPDALSDLSFNILQGSRRRSVKTEFISCPSCGRTLFNLQEVAARIREKTSHLPGVKIAIMGCIVNGPGEMADAHFGYVGSKPGKIDLYVGKKCVERNIDFKDADDKLIDLIKAHGMWVDNLVLV